ncbi:hypothetical protein C1H46_004739 [Malus baccata]|uniref:Uncharacterized protein n=1 Tax=Malus baccata TaxID=106549 RepID=A0A540NF67_MALBA|nr:hypothetical protein C1H46_004739 [Malus baccata]
MIAFGSFDLVLLQVTPDHSRLCSSYTTPSIKSSLGQATKMCLLMMKNDGHW